MSRLRKDIAPGEPHIELRRKGVSYFATSLFHLAPTYQKTVPLLIRDVLTAKLPLEIYGAKGARLTQEGYLFVKNHPIRKFKICGRLMSFSTRFYENPDTKEQTEYINMYVDDSSGENSTICVKSTLNEVPEFVLHDDILVEVTGTLCADIGSERHIQLKEVKVVGSSLDISVELAWWASVLETRKSLQVPWIYVPPKLRKDVDSPQAAFHRGDMRNKEEKRKILQPAGPRLLGKTGANADGGLRNSRDENSTHSAHFAPVTDSFYLYDTRDTNERAAVDICRPPKRVRLGPDCGRESQEMEMERTEVIDITGAD